MNSSDKMNLPKFAIDVVIENLDDCSIDIEPTNYNFTNYASIIMLTGAVHGITKLWLSQYAEIGETGALINISFERNRYDDSLLFNMNTTGSIKDFSAFREIMINMVNGIQNKNVDKSNTKLTSFTSKRLVFVPFDTNDIFNYTLSAFCKPEMYNMISYIINQSIVKANSKKIIPEWSHSTDIKFDGNTVIHITSLRNSIQLNLELSLAPNVFPSKNMTENLGNKKLLDLIVNEFVNNNPSACNVDEICVVDITNTDYVLSETFMHYVTSINDNPSSIV